MASPAGTAAESNEKPPSLGPRVASFGALLAGNAPSQEEGRESKDGQAELHLYTTSAEGTFHSMKGEELS